METVKAYDNQQGDGRPPAPGRPEHPAKRPNPWIQHLLSLVGREVEVSALTTPLLIAARGVVLAVSHDHTNLALRLKDGRVATIRGGGMVISECQPRRSADPGAGAP